MKVTWRARLLRSPSSIGVIAPAPDAGAASNRLRLACAAASLGIFVFVFFPCFVNTFGVHNDYNIWAYSSDGGLLAYPESLQLLAIGRPVNALLTNLHLVYFNHHYVESLAFARMLSVLTLLACFAIFVRILTRRFELSPLFAHLLGILIFLLPSALIFTYWVLNYVPGLVGTLLACMSYYLFSVPVMGRRPSPRRGYLWSLLGAAVLLTDMFVYPPTALFVLVFPAAGVLFANRLPGEDRKRLAMECCLVAAVLLVYYAANSAVVTPLLKSLIPAYRDYPQGWTKERYSFSPGFNSYLLGDYLAATLNLWTANYVPYFHLAVSGIIILAFARAAARSIVVRRMVTGRPSRGMPFPGQKSRDFLARAGILAFTGALASTPVLIPKGSFVAFRIIFLPAALGVLLLTKALLSLSAGSRPPAGRLSSPAGVVLLSMVLLLCVVCARHRIDEVVDSATREYSFVAGKFARYDWTAREPILIILPQWGSLFAGKHLDYDFMYLGVNFYFHGGIFVENVLKKFGKPPSFYRQGLATGLFPNLVSLEYSEIDDSFRKYLEDTGHYIIDFNEAGFQPRAFAFSKSLGPLALPYEHERIP